MKPIRAMSLCLLLLTLAIAAPAQASFDTAQRAAVAHNPPGLTCTLRLVGNRTTFHMGETIPVALDLTSSDLGKYRINPWVTDQITMDLFHASPSKGIAEMRTTFGGGGTFSGHIPRIAPITSQPSTVPLTLNNWLRFDQPGVYHIYAVSRRALKSGVYITTLGNFAGGKPAASNIISLTILPPDLAWSHQQVLSATSQINHPGQSIWNKVESTDILRYLDTKESAQALLAIMAADRYPRSSDTGIWLCRQGLLEFPDRPWLIQEMKRDIAAPGYTVTQTFLETFSTLAASQHAQDYGRVQLALWKEAADAAPSKTASALPITLHSLLATAWLNPAIGSDPSVKTRLPGLVHRMAVVFDQLPPLPQQYLLGGDWPRMTTPALLPALRRAWAAAVRPEHGNTPTDLNNLILRRLYELSPKEGRALILKEAASPKPRASIAALTILPDKTLPALDTPLAAYVASNSDMETTCDLIARYATPAIFPQVKSAYSDPSRAGPARPRPRS